MTIPTLKEIKLGNYPNDGTGDDLRTAFLKVNSNFKTLFDEGAIINGTNLGNGAAILTGKNTTNLNLEFKTITTDTTIIVDTTNTNHIHLSSVTKLENDGSPKLGSNLNLNGHYTFGGDTQSTIYGLDFPVLNNLLSSVLSSNNLNLDLGTISNPTGFQQYPKGYPIDLNGTGVINGFNDPLENDYDFGELINTQIIPVSTTVTTAILASVQTIPTSAETIITLSAESDINVWFSNNRFQPNIPGWYNISYSVTFASGLGTGSMYVKIFKNTSSVHLNENQVNTNVNRTVPMSFPVYLNGINDYVLLKAYTSSSSGQVLQVNPSTVFSAVLIK